jgi:lipoate-protein ligase B
MAQPRVEIRRHKDDAPWTYAMLDERQREVALRVAQGGMGALLLSEVAPVITFGRRAGEADLLVSSEGLARIGISTYTADRGGLATYHGPGQWVLFVVDSLERLTGDPRGVRQAVQGLLEVALEVGRTYAPEAEIHSGLETGVWTPRGKFAAVGVHVQDGIVLHGLSVNGFRTQTSFQGLRPCGLDKPVDYLLTETNDESFEDLGRRLRESALTRFFSKRS